jgi:hypothetical protein
MNSSFYKIAMATLALLNISQIIHGFAIAPRMCMSAGPVGPVGLTLRNGKVERSERPGRTANCNKKYLYINYLLTLRHVKKTIKNSASTASGTGGGDVLYNINNMIENIINVTATVNPQNLAETKESMLFVGKTSDTNGVNGVIINDDLTAKKLLLANIQIDVSNIKYIQISTKNDTLIVELDKNNNVGNDKNVIKYDLKQMDALISAVSILMNLLNVH